MLIGGGGGKSERRGGAEGPLDGEGMGGPLEAGGRGGTWALAPGPGGGGGTEPVFLVSETDPLSFETLPWAFDGLDASSRRAFFMSLK